MALAVSWTPPAVSCGYAMFTGAGRRTPKGVALPPNAYEQDDESCLHDAACVVLQLGLKAMAKVSLSF